MTNQAVDILIPTYNNGEQLLACVESILRAYVYFPVHIYIINNGRAEVTKQPAFTSPRVTILYPDRNLGWEGGLNLGLAQSKSRYVMFMNDDTYVPESSKTWLKQLLEVFRDPTVGAVGPSTNVVMGPQNIFTEPNMRTQSAVYQVPYLIGYCVLLRREALDKSGGIDETLPGGDDLDWSIRLEDNGYSLFMHRGVFVWHYGFQTGTRLYGDSTKPGGWNSKEMSDTTNIALIKKHGLKRWFEALHTTYEGRMEPTEDVEGNIIREAIIGDRVADLGCGGQKTIPEAVGVDEVPNGERIPMLLEGHNISQADVVADATKTLPFEDSYFDTVIARHILEHIPDPITAIREWGRILRPGGRLIIAVPNQDEVEVIPLNPEHRHAWNAASLHSLLDLLGFKKIQSATHFNGTSLIGVYEQQ